jgi:hypothetical protein
MGRSRAVLGLALGLLGCSSGGGASPAISNAPCSIGEVSFLQQQGDMQVAVQAKATNVFVQYEGMPPYNLSVSGSADGGVTEAVQVSWNVPLSYGELAAITGTVVMSGQTICAGHGSSVEEVASDGASIPAFQLALRTLSTGSTCPGTPLVGTLDVCVDASL